MSEPVLEKVGTVFITVRNLEQSVKWYAEKLGLKMAYHWGTGADFLVGAGPTLLTMVEKIDMEPLGMLHGNVPCYAFESREIERTHSLLSSRGVAVTPIVEYDMVSTFQFRDPDGNLINVGCEKPNSPHYQA